jgi:hypothetical protein
LVARGKKVKNKTRCQAGWCTSVIPALERLRQEDCDLKASQGNIARPCLKNKTNNK